MHPHVLNMVEAFLSGQLPPFICLGIAVELAQARWQPAYGITIDSDVLRNAGMNRLATKHPRVAFGVKRAA